MPPELLPCRSIYPTAWPVCMRIRDPRPDYGPRMVALTRLRRVDFCQSWWRSAWLQESTSPADLLSKRGTVISELFSHHLSNEHVLQAQTHWARFVFDPSVAAWSPGPVPAQSKAFGEGEVHNVPFPADIASLHADHPRRSALLDLLVDHLNALAEVRGWDRSVIAAVADACRQDDLSLELLTKPKSSPNRKRKVALRYSIDGEGDGWVQLLQVEGEDVAEVGAPLPAQSEHGTFRDLASSLRWLDNDRVSFAPWSQRIWTMPGGATMGGWESFIVPGREPRA